MKQQLVRDWMTSNPITITTSTVLPEAHALMNKHRIRRLPVVDGDELKGIVTWGDIREARPSDASSINVFELHHMLSRLPVSKIMTTEVMTISPDAPIGMAAKLMYDHRIASLPVMEDDKIVGIITASDIFRVVIQLSGYKEERAEE